MKKLTSLIPIITTAYTVAAQQIPSATFTTTLSDKNITARGFVRSVEPTLDVKLTGNLTNKLGTTYAFAWMQYNMTDGKQQLNMAGAGHTFDTKHAKINLEITGYQVYQNPPVLEGNVSVAFKLPLNPTINYARAEEGLQGNLYGLAISHTQKFKPFDVTVNARTYVNDHFGTALSPQISHAQLEVIAAKKIKNTKLQIGARQQFGIASGFANEYMIFGGVSVSTK